ncbi:MAG: GNAT family N-acetyltransferase [Elusimicrobia bacterium]|nr:GNAT family N-acetyltransferase [Elusimicrobiota bacterium]
MAEAYEKPETILRGSSFQQEEFILRLIEEGDNPHIAHVICRVMPEFGASGSGFAINDPEVSDMYQAYSQGRAVYFVLCRKDVVVGGAGIAPLEGGPEEVCELRKMYFLPEARGKGFGQRLLDKCLTAAVAKGFKRCYLETLKDMTRARKLYEKNGFLPLDKPMGNTGHYSCDAWYARIL